MRNWYVSFGFPHSSCTLVLSYALGGTRTPNQQSRNLLRYPISLRRQVRVVGLEPTLFRISAECFNQLSYTRISSYSLDCCCKRRCWWGHSTVNKQLSVCCPRHHALFLVIRNVLLLTSESRHSVKLLESGLKQLHRNFIVHCILLLGVFAWQDRQSPALHIWRGGVG